MNRDILHVDAFSVLIRALAVALFTGLCISVFLFDPYSQNHALWLAMVLFIFARGLIQTLIFKRAIMLLLH